MWWCGLIRRHCARAMRNGAGVYLAEREAEVPKVGRRIQGHASGTPSGDAQPQGLGLGEGNLARIPARAIAARTRTGEVTWLLTTLPGKQMPAIGILDCTGCAGRSNSYLSV